MSELAGRERDVGFNFHALDARTRGLSLAWPFGLIAAILYGSLLPFDIDWTAYRPATLFGLLDLTAWGTTREDLVTNVLIYTPVGLALVLCGDHRHRSRPARIATAVLVGAAVSLLAEILQTGIAVRVASWVDVALNTLGTAIGALIGTALSAFAAITIRPWIRALIDRPATTMASVATLGLLLYGLMPFDFITDTAGLHASFGRARWDLTGARPIAFAHPPFELLIGQLCGALWFAALGYLLALAESESRGRPARFAALQGLVLAAVVECMQLFTASHSFDLAVVVLRSLAVLAGVSCAVFFRGRRPSLLQPGKGFSGAQRPGLTIPTVVLAALIVFQVLARLLSSVDPSLLTAKALDLAHVRWIPFEAMWRLPAAKAATEALASLIAYGTLAVTLAMVLRRARARSVWLVTGAVVTLVATAVEILHFSTVSYTPDLTGPALAVAVVVVASRVYPPVASAFSARPAVLLAEVERSGSFQASYR